jgi:hypothetical protein
MIDRASKLFAIKLEELELDGTEDDITNLCFQGFARPSLSRRVQLDPCHAHGLVIEFRRGCVYAAGYGFRLDALQVKLEKAPISSSALATAGYCTHQSRETLGAEQRPYRRGSHQTRHGSCSESFDSVY